MRHGEIRWVGGVSQPTEEQRAAIRQAAERFFRRSLTIDERVFRALGVVTKKRRDAPLSWHVWWSIYSATPGLARMYDRLGADPRPPRKLYALESDNLGEDLDWSRTFAQSFLVRTSRLEGELVPAAQEIQFHGHLSIEGLAVGLLQSGAIGPVNGWTGRESRLTNPIVRRLLAGSNGRTRDFREWGESAERLTARASELTRHALAVDESFGDQQFLLFYEGDQIRLRPFGSSGAQRLSDGPLRDGSLWIARSNALEPLERFGDEALLELESLISANAPELAFQRFFELNPLLLTTLGPWKSMHAQLVLHREGDGSLIPDMFLERLDSNFCDILDLKRPTAELVRRQKNRVRFRDAVMEGVAQLREYRDWFESPQNRSDFRERYGLDAYRPKAAIVIGRRTSYYDEVERIRLESGLPEWVELRTYDDVLAGVQRWRRSASGG